MFIQHPRSRGMALLITLIMVLLLSLEVAMISLVALRGMGDEGKLFTRNTAARRGAEVAISRLNTQITKYLNGGGLPIDVETTFAKGQVNALASTTMTLSNPDGGGTDNTPITIEAWVKERRGNAYHVIGRASVDSTDLVLHRWISICRPGILSTILVSAGNGAGYGDNTLSLAVASDGRLFYGDSYSGSGSFYTWHEGTGLTTLASGLDYPGYESVQVGQDGRVFWGQDSSPNTLWTWKASTGLSTLLPGTAGMRQKVTTSSTDGRVYFAKYSSSGTGAEWSWKEGSGLTTISSTLTYNQAPPVVSSGGRVFFGEWSKVISWSPSAGLTTLCCYGVIQSVRGVTSSERIFVSDSSTTPSDLWTWKVGQGNLTTSVILNSSNIRYPYTAMASDGRFYIAESSNPGKLWTWKEGIGLTTIGTFNGPRELWLTASGRLYFQDSSKMYTWSTSTGLTTILTSGISSSSYDTYYYDLVTPQERVFFISNTNPGSIWTWSTSTGLTTIVSNMNYPGYASTAVAFNDRLYFGTSSAFMTWTPTDGLNTILTGSWLGEYSVIVAPDGRVYFGDAGQKMWTWKEQDCSSL